MISIEQTNPQNISAPRKSSKKSLEGINVSTSRTLTTPQEPSQPVEAPARTTKLQQLVELLEAPDGTTIEAMCVVTGWQAHSVGGALAGVLKRKGVMVVSTKPANGASRRYHIGEKP